MGQSNPFFHRGPIRERAYFFGREQEMSQALTLLGNRQSLSLVGQRRIGKTSFLFQMADPHTLARHGLSPDQHLLVYLDCGGLTGLDPPGLYRAILEEMDDALAERGASPAGLEALDDSRPIPYRAFERALRGLSRQGWLPTLVLYEFDLLARDPRLDPDFFSGLRALTTRYPVAYATASRHSLLELTYAQTSALSSPFFNIFARIQLVLLSEAEARNLLGGLAAQGGQTFAPATLDFLLDLAGPHPLFLQIAGFHAFELQAASAEGLSQADTAELRQRFTASAEEHFDYYWRHLSAAEQQAMARLPAAQAGQPEVVRRLEQGCLVQRRGAGYDYLSSAWRAFVQSQPLPGRLQAGPLSIDEGQRLAWLHGQPLNLTSTQYTLLVYLAEHAGQVVAGADLEKAVWGEVYVEDPERLKSVIKGLRRALGGEAARLENVRGVGYAWRG